MAMHDVVNIVNGGRGSGMLSGLTVFSVGSFMPPDCASALLASAAVERHMDLFASGSKADLPDKTEMFSHLRRHVLIVSRSQSPLKVVFRK